MTTGTSTATLAYLHAHGLDLEPEGLPDDLSAAIKTLKALIYAKPGEEGLTAPEIEVAQSGGLSPNPAWKRGDPLLGGVMAYTLLLRTGLTARQAAKRLGVSDARIRQRLQARSLLGVHKGRAWTLPKFQFTATGELPGWDLVCLQLPQGVSPVAVSRWVNLPHSDLVSGPDRAPMSPRAWLIEGRPAETVAALAGELA